MRVSQAVLGAFHHFELARELERRGHLQTIYSTWPWRRLRREGVSRQHLATSPWVHTPHMLLQRYGINPPCLDNALSVLARLTLDRFVARHSRSHPAPDAFISLSSAVLTAARELQRRGTRFVCDRACTHQLHQERLVTKECLRWRIPPPRYSAIIRQRELDSYQHADAITVPSHAAARTFPKFGVLATKVHVIPYGVRLETFTQSANPPTNSFEVLFIGQLTLRKGLPYLLQAFAALKHPRKRLTIIGSPNAQVTRLLPTLPTEYVRFLGALPQAELPGHLSRSHVLVLPSIEEGLALVQAQAMACGCPVLATTATGAEDLFTDGIEGFIVEPRDPAQLATRLDQLAADPGLRNQMSAAAKQRVRTLGGWQTYGNQWESLLATLTR